ncbi:MAG TPA: carboxypeptidase-like regulatory domain-containing protein, partial [Thermoanaerobaculia bacterium]
AAYDATSLTYATEFYRDEPTFRGADIITVSGGQRVNGYDFELQRGGRYEGSVTDAATSQPLGGIGIAAYDADGVLVSQTTTLADGRYALVVPAGAYRVLAFDEQLRYSTRYAGNAVSFETTADRQVNVGGVTTVNFALQRGVKVTGTVTDSSGRPIAGIEVFALDPNGNRVGASTTNRSGAFAIVLPANTYTFLARDPEGRFVSAHRDQPLVVSEGSARTVTFALSSGTRRRAAGSR